MPLSSSNALHLTFTIINYMYFFVDISIHYNMVISNRTFELQTENKEYLLIQKKELQKSKIVLIFTTLLAY